MTDPTPAMLTTAKGDLTIAYNDAAGRPADNATLYAGGFNLASLTTTPGVGLAPGVYRGSSSLSLTGTLTLDAGGVKLPNWELPRSAA